MDAFTRPHQNEQIINMPFQNIIKNQRIMKMEMLNQYLMK